MKSLQTLTTVIPLLFGLMISDTYAGQRIPSKMDFTAAIEYSLDLLDRSPYKSIQLQTNSGSFSGDFVTKTKDVIVLKNKTNSIHMKSGKEKLLMSFIKINTITAISVNVLDK